jgi:Family of unknown function (DUF6111)
MSRVLLQYVLPLLLPTIVWLVWWFTLGRHRTTAEGITARIEHGPWFWLILGGVGLLGLSLIYTAITRGFDPQGTYIPPRWEDGRVVPGRVE